MTMCLIFICLFIIMITYYSLLSGTLTLLSSFSSVLTAAIVGTLCSLFRTVPCVWRATGKNRCISHHLVLSLLWKLTRQLHPHFCFVWWAKDFQRARRNVHEHCWGHSVHQTNNSVGRMLDSQFVYDIFPNENPFEWIGQKWWRWRQQSSESNTVRK